MALQNTLKALADPIRRGDIEPAETGEAFRRGDRRALPCSPPPSISRQLCRARKRPDRIRDQREGGFPSITN